MNKHLEFETAKWLYNEYSSLYDDRPKKERERDSRTKTKFDDLMEGDQDLWIEEARRLLKTIKKVSKNIKIEKKKNLIRKVLEERK